MDGDDGNPRYDDLDSGEREGNMLQEDGPGGRAGAAFNPAPYFRQLRGRGGAQDYLDVKFRLLWLRREHPDAETLTEHIRIDDGVAIFKATVSIPGGGKATGHGSETATDFPDYIEKAETKALGRALNALGYGAQFAEAEAEAETENNEAPSVAPPEAPVARPPAQPAPRAAATAPAATSRAATTEESPTPPATPAPTPMPARGAADRRAGTGQARPAPVEIGAARERATPATPTPFPNPAPARQGAPTAVTESEPPLEDYSWTAFWKWAREQGYESKGGIEAFIGRPMNNLNPAEVRQLIIAKRGDT
ncbi:MAG: hypothetical protein QOF33_1415 [Thermomicrobiales bacterium]|jgi:hypothetical protein|nr:hypothetical protein [Thermomicrobiales bacterium]